MLNIFLLDNEIYLVFFYCSKFSKCKYFDSDNLVKFIEY